MKVYIPAPLRSYTADKSTVESGGATIREVLAELDRCYPGLRFRIIDEQDGIRQHIKIFVNEEMVDGLSVSTRPNDTIHIICALSGG
jgi:sulfur-carrier protein